MPLESINWMRGFNTGAFKFSSQEQIWSDPPKKLSMLKRIQERNAVVGDKRTSVQLMGG